MMTKNTKRRKTTKKTTEKEYASPAGAIANMNEIRNKLLMDARIRVDDRINPQHDKVLKDYLNDIIEAASTMKVHTQYEQNAFIETMKGINYLIYKHDDPVSDDVYNDDDMRSIVVSFSNYMHDNQKACSYVVSTANMNRIILGYQLCELIHEFIITKPDREAYEQEYNSSNDDTVNNTSGLDADNSDADKHNNVNNGSADAKNKDTDSHVNKDVFTAVMMAHALNDLKEGFDYQFAVQNAIIFKNEIIRRNLEEEAAEAALKAEQDKANSDSDDSSNDLNANNIEAKQVSTEK